MNYNWMVFLLFFIYPFLNYSEYNPTKFINDVSYCDVMTGYEKCLEKSV